MTNDMLASTKPGFLDQYGDTFNSATLSASWVRSTLNKGILATRGNYQSLNLTAGIPSTDLEYFKLEYNGQYFQPLTNSLTLRFKTDLGYGEGYGDMDRLPFFQNFFAGGFGSVRGFRKSTLGPQISPVLSYTPTTSDVTAIDTDGDGVNDNIRVEGQAYVLCDKGSAAGIGCAPGKLVTQAATTTGRAFGGNIITEFSAELIFPVPFIEDQRSIQMALFADAGNVFDTHCGDMQENCSNFDLSKLSSSYGLGLSWLSSFGPLTFSIARPIQRSETDDSEFFQFSMGAGF